MLPQLAVDIVPRKGRKPTPKVEPQLNRLHFGKTVQIIQHPLTTHAAFGPMMPQNIYLHYQHTCHHW
jgi:hypothetical protein